MSFKIAVIGCGWVSKACHGPAYQLAAETFSELELAACCDSDNVRATEFQSLFGFQRIYSNYREMLDAEYPGMVALNVPPKLTCEIGVEVLQRGIPLLAEKPPGLHVSEVDRLVEAALKNHTANMVAFNRRHMPLMVELKRQLSDSSFGNIHYQLSRVGRVNEDFSVTAIHAIDAVRFLTGSDFQKIQFRYGSHPALGKDVLDYHLDCVMTNGITANIDVNPVAGLNIERAEIQGEQTTFLLQCNNGFDAPGSLKIYDRGKPVLDLNGADFSGSDKAFVLDGFFNEDAAFFQAVTTGAEIKDDIQSGRQSVEIMQCLREHAAEFNLKSRESQ